MFSWKIVRKTHTPSDKKLEEIRKILFPPLDTQTEMVDNKPVKFHVDYAIDSNLDAALIDLREGNNDDITQNTILKAITKLNEVRRLMEAYAQIDADAKYIIVDSRTRETEIVAADDENDLTF